MSTPKAGKIPVSAKGKSTAEFYLGVAGSEFDVPQNCRDELRKKNLECRWVDINELKKTNNRHRHGWVPMKFDCLTNKGPANPFSDASLDGFLTMRGMVLAAKSSEAVAAQKQLSRRKTMLQANAGKSAAAELKEMLKSDKNFKVHEGYDDEDGE